MRRFFGALLIVLVAFTMRAVDGPRGAYLHGVSGISDEPAYIGEAFYLNAALSGEQGEDPFLSYTPPLHQLLLSFAPLLSPFSLAPSDRLTLPDTTVRLASPDGRPHLIGYLPIGSDPSLLLPALDSISWSASIFTQARARWIEEASRQIESGEPVLLSVFAPGTTITPDPSVRLTEDALLIPREDGLALIDRSSGETVALLSSRGVRSFASSVGADDPLSLLVASIDEAGVLRVWRMSDQLRSPWGTGLILSREIPFEEAASVAAGPTGDLLLVSAKTERGWELLTYESTSSVSRIGSTPTEGPLELRHLPAERETLARDTSGEISRVEGGPIIGARTIVALIGALGAFFAWLFGLRVGGRRLAFGAGLLFALDPLGVASGRIAYQDQTVATLTMATVAAMAFVLSPGAHSRRYLLLGLVAGLAAATKGFSYPVAFVALFVAAMRLPHPLRIGASVVGAAAGLLLLVNGSSGSPGLLIGGVGALLLAIVLVRSADPMPSIVPLVAALSGVVAGYLVPWLLRDLIFVSALGYPLFFSVTDTHITIFSNAAREFDRYVSTWWLWPTGLGAGSIDARESGSIIWAHGAILAAGLLAAVGSTSRLGRSIAIMLLLAWGSWAIPVRYQMPYYALVPTVIAGAAIILAARERPTAGRIAIPLALLAPLAGGLLLPFRLESALIALSLAVIVSLIVTRLLRSVRVPAALSITGWLVAWSLSLGLAIAYTPALGVALGLAAGLAARGGWRLAPFGAALSGVPLLSGDWLAALGFVLPAGIEPIASITQPGVQLHPLGLALLGLLVVAGVVVARRARHARRFSDGAIRPLRPR